MRRMLFPLTLLAVLGAITSQKALCEDAAELHNKGVGLFMDADYQGAANAFMEADVALPENLRIAFAKACAELGLGNIEKAQEGFRDAAMARDVAVAAPARYNMGCVASEKARTLFGEHPEEADPALREQGLGHLLAAVGHFKDCIKLKGDHARARHNLELIRLWIKHMKAVWKEKDKDKAREEMNLLRFLEMIVKKQEAIKTLCMALKYEDDSPRKRQVLDEAQEEQQSLALEIDPLNKKIESEIKGASTSQGGGGATGQAPPSGAPGGIDPDEAEKTMLVLQGWADEAQGYMEEAAGLMPEEVKDALPPQKSALESLDRIFGAVAPYQAMVQKLLETQQGAVNRTVPIAQTPGDDTHVEGSADETSDLSWIEQRAAGWSDVLAFKARNGLETIDKQQPAGAGPGAVMQGADQEKMKEQIEGIKKSMEKAIELCPRVRELCAGASEELGRGNAEAALPDEEEALKLLKEIADPLPKQDQNKQGDQNKDDQQQDGQNKEQEQDKGEQQKKEQPRKELSKNQAEAILQKVKERERDYKNKKKEHERALLKPSKTEKDW